MHFSSKKMLTFSLRFWQLVFDPKTLYIIQVSS
jgi:hypothetical protein